VKEEERKMVEGCVETISRQWYGIGGKDQIGNWGKGGSRGEKSSYLGSSKGWGIFFLF